MRIHVQIPLKTQNIRWFVLGKERAVGILHFVSAFSMYFEGHSVYNKSSTVNTKVVGVFSSFQIYTIFKL